MVKKFLKNYLLFKKTGVLFFLIFLLLVITSCTTNNVTNNKNLDELASCITNSGAIMYGTEWCTHCKNQKKMFGSSFRLINYVNCDQYRNECVSAGIKGYPTWNINNSLYLGTQDLYFLAEKTGCIDKLLY